MSSAGATALCGACKEIFIKSTPTWTSLFRSWDPRDFYPTACPVCAHICTFIRGYVSPSPASFDGKSLLDAGIDGISYHYTTLRNVSDSSMPSSRLEIDVSMRELGVHQQTALTLVPKDGQSFCAHG